MFRSVPGIDSEEPEANVEVPFQPGRLIPIQKIRQMVFPVGPGFPVILVGEHPGE